MKNEAVNMRPTDTMRTASVGYHSTGTGLEIAFAACDTTRRTPRVSTAQHSTAGSQAEPWIYYAGEGGRGGLTIPRDLLLPL